MRPSLWLKICIILGIKVVLHSAEISQDNLRKLEKSRIIPDYAKYFHHCVEAEIKFKAKSEQQSNFRIIANFGNTIDLQTVSDKKPEIRWLANVGEYYTVALIDPDVIRFPPQPVERMHWLIVNVPGCWLPGGQEIIPYQRPENPTKEGEVHKIIALIYQQDEGIMNVTETSLKSDELVAGMRNAFRIRKFAQHYDLMFPFAMNFFLAEYKDPKIPPASQNRPPQQNQQMKKQKQQQQQQQQKQKQQQQQQQQQQQKQKQQQQNQNHQRQKPQQNQKQRQQDQSTAISFEPGEGQKQKKHHQNQHKQRQQNHNQQQTPPDGLMDAFKAAQKQDYLNQQRQRETEHQKQHHQLQSSTTSKYYDDQEEEDVTLDSAELLRRQGILDHYRNIDEGHTQREWIIIETTENPIRAIYMRDYREKQRRKHQQQHQWSDPPSPTTSQTTQQKWTESSTKKDEWAGIMTMQMPIVPDFDEFQMDEEPRTKPRPSTTMNPIRARYMQDYEEKKRRREYKKLTTIQDEWSGRMTMQMPIVPDFDEFQMDEEPRRKLGPSTTMNPIRARYMQDYREKKRREKIEEEKKKEKLEKENEKKN